MEATVLLCDHAEAVNGKLYVLGGGWTVLFAPDTPVNIALAIVIAVPWDRTNERHELTIELLDHDGNIVEIGGHEIRVATQFEVGRPPGIKAGTALNTPLTWAFNGLPLPEGGYEFKVSINGEPVSSRPFVVAQPPHGVGPPAMPG
jgi:hypothetical protein